ncbi:MAG: AmmeMemoRadiSam system protein B [Vallitalea sp.]|nr:AmmeMemoRadiSam system protein B [Vallitalea sp.]
MRRLYMVIMAIIIILSGCNYKSNVADKKIEIDENKVIKDEEIIAVKDQTKKERPPTLDSTDFIRKKTFYNSIGKSSKFDSSNIIAGIIPHHDVACKYIASFYKTVAEQKDPDIVIIIGPNHPGTGPRFQVGNFDFNTRSGVINSNSNIIYNLAKNPIMYLSEKDVFEKEHSVGLHMNYIRYYFPSAEVVPIIIGETRNLDGILEVAQDVVKEIKDKDILLIASIDFSHYLTLEQANEKDKLTREIINNSDVRQMIGLGNDHIDSPSSYGLLMEILNQMGITYKCKINGNDNSANIIGDTDIKETTSYFFVSYERVDD